MGRTLVTGGAKGLGAAICRKLASEGHHIVVHYNTSEKEAIKLADECRGEFIQGNFLTHEGILRFIENYKQRFEKTEYLVNNVGNYLIKSASQTTGEELSALYQTNVLAPFMITHALDITESVINLGVAGLHERADAYSSAYMMTKAALLQWTRSLAKEWASKGVSVNMISPGYIEDAIDLPEVKTLPMKRAATHEEVSQLIAYFLDKKNRYMTGQNIEIAGGVRL